MSNGEDDDATHRRSTELADTSASPSATKQPAADELPGVLKGRFVLEERIGDGGMGSVYKALDRNRQAHNDPQPYVALKILKTELLREHPDAALALQREASRTLRLSHHNIVRVHDFDMEGDANFITMELLQGESLVSMLDERPRGLPLNHVLFLLEQLCDGLAYAHDQGIVHSDLKPSNIFVTTGGVLKILDFGIAAPLRRLDTKVATTLYDPRKLRALTPSHASPEQWQQLAADPRDDVYSLGCIVYELLSGQHPFDGTNAMVAAKNNMKVRPIPSLSAQQNAALRKALSFKREERTASAEQVYLDLKQSVAQGPSRQRWVALSGAVVAGVAVAAWMTLDRPMPEPSSPVAKSEDQPPAEKPAEAAAGPTTDTAPPAQPNTTAPSGGTPTQAMVKSVVCAGEQPRDLNSAIDAGLEALSFLSFSSESSLQNDCKLVRSAKECLENLHQKGAENSQSRALLADLGTKLSASCQ